ncbi:MULTISPECIES: hypothetical protein [Rhodanobacter]|uniref:hypothetical protein n=1 Tax=Rhodanobacter TaxID=75309 RepID=UPI000AAE97DE|nr:MULTISPECIES: hypothetical protein [Rhodanobacter]UJJ55224.1 hypothetical protein LRK53_02130 [Rhodanobacter thiooxydans]
MNIMNWHPRLHSQTPAIKAISLFSPPRPCNAWAWGAPMNNLVITDIRTRLFSEVVS